MASCSEQEKTFKIYWHIENFHFCWHKTGECLESPLFKIKLSDETFWRLQLYPRGEDDGEYMGCYVLREEGGPEEVHVGILFYIQCGTVMNKWFVSEMQSIKVHQREGHKCHISRAVFAPKVFQADEFLIRICCKIISQEGHGTEGFFKLLRTRILVERFKSTEILDNFDDYCDKDIDVEPMVKDKTLIKINLSYFEDSLVIKIYPISCKEIKYAMFKIILLKICGKESPIEHVSHWIGKIKNDVWRYQVKCLEGASSKHSCESFSHKYFIFRYDFAFSTGVVEEKCEVIDISAYISEYEMCDITSNVSLQQFWTIKVKTTNSTPTALGALEDNYASKAFVDMNFKVEETFHAHKSIIHTRCPRIRSFKEDDVLNLNLEAWRSIYYYEAFFRFLYTDALGILSVLMANSLFQIASYFDVELLKTKCRKFLIDGIDCSNAYIILCCARREKDLTLKTAVENYIASHYDSVLQTTCWENLDDKPEWRRETLFLKYKK